MRGNYSYGYNPNNRGGEPLREVRRRGWEPRLDGWYAKPGYGWIKRWKDKCWCLYPDEKDTRHVNDIGLKRSYTIDDSYGGPYRTLTEAVEAASIKLDPREVSCAYFLLDAMTNCGNEKRQLLIDLAERRLLSIEGQDLIESLRRDPSDENMAKVRRRLW